MMTKEQKETVIQLHSGGMSFRKIAEKMGLSEGSVTLCWYRNQPKEEAGSTPESTTAEESLYKPCKNCGVPVLQATSRREKKFCSDRCRCDWWNHHRELFSNETLYPGVCPNCGKEFSAPVRRTYCCRACYLEYVSKEEAADE